ncbi:ABC transporter permease subunit, partial [Bacillus altitudinis]|uniref:ABC transporter permease subunit n=1 Tax=Bacillus altitudinis TaxID=293387 RepID=UPI001915CE7D
MNAVGDLLPLLPAGTRLLVGPGSTAVRSVRGVVGTPDQVGRSLAQGDDVVVLLTPVDRADARFDVLLRRASAAGTTLLVVDGALELGPGTTTLADRLGVAVLATPDPWATSVRLHELIGTGMGPAARAALDASRVALDAGPELDDLFARPDRSLGHPVRFLDASGLALRGAAVDDTARAVLVRRAGTSDVLIAEGVDETLVAIPVGMLQAARRNGAVDYAATALAFVFYSTPAFFLGLVLIIVFSQQLPWLPSQAPSGNTLAEVFQDPAGLVLPVVTGALAMIAVFSRYMRASTLENLQEDYVRTARAGGASTATILRRHVFRNSLT